MFLFLTSSAHLVLNKLIPFLRSDPKNLKVAFIPTAGDIYKEKPWQEQDRNKLQELGFVVEDVDIKKLTGGNLRKKLSGVDIIFVAGGNTSYLLEQAQQSGFLEIAKNLIKKGKIYIGSSAGSLLAGPNVELDKIYDEGDFGKVLDSYEALGFVDFIILPHAQRQEYEQYMKKIEAEYGKKYPLKRLNDNEAILVKDDRIEMIVG